MAQPSQPISPLRQRMIDDMHIRQLAPKTQVSYIRAVKKLADYLGHSPHTATAQDLRQFQLYLTDQGTSRITINTTITSLRFFFVSFFLFSSFCLKCKDNSNSSSSSNSLS